MEQTTTTPPFPALTKSAEDSLVTQQTQPVIAAPKKGQNSRFTLELTTPLPAVFQSQEEDDAHALGLQTVSMRVVKDIQVKKKATTFFAVVVGWLLSLSFLCGLAYLCFLVSDPIYKVEILLIFLIALSYIASAQMKLLDRLRPSTKPFLSVTQLVPAVKKEPEAQEDKDMGHFKLIKEDTTTYLQAITKQNLKKDKYQ